MDERVAGLVYIAALAPDADETSQSQPHKFPVTPVFQHIEVADGRIWLKPDGIGCFAGDLSEAEQKLVLATRSCPIPTCSTRKSKAPPSAPNPAGTSWPRTIDGASRTGTRRRQAQGRPSRMEIASSHVPMLSHPRHRAGGDPRRREQRHDGQKRHGGGINLTRPRGGAEKCCAAR